MAVWHVSLSCNEHLNMVGWEICVSGARVRGGVTMYEYLGTSTSRVQYSAMYNVYSGGERSSDDSDT